MKKLGYEQDAHPIGANSIENPYGFFFNFGNTVGECDWGTCWYESVEAMIYDICHGMFHDAFLEGLWDELTEPESHPLYAALKKVTTWDELKSHEQLLGEFIMDFIPVTLNDYLSNPGEHYSGARSEYWESAHEREDCSDPIPESEKEEFAEWLSEWRGG